MTKSLPTARSRSPGSDSDGTDPAYEQSIVIPNRLITIADSFEKKEHSWFVTSQIPTDLLIQVQDVTFNVHKYPLVSKCGYIGRLELQPSISNFGCDLKLENFPAGSETFEIILKFCYGLPVDFNSNNIGPLRCASEYLDMSEEYEDGNLISKTEAFLTLVILSSWKETITVIKSCETLSPWAENLQIVRRCCDSIAWKASRENSTSEDIVNEEGWWFEDVATFRIDHFTRIITTIKAKGIKPEIIGKCIIHYANKWLPGMDVELEGLRGYGYGKNELQFSIMNRGNEEGSVGHKEQRAIIESLVSILPPQQEAVPCKFFLQMLKMAMVYSASPALISELEKRVGIMLEDVKVNDLLIPNYKNEDQGKLVNSPEQHTMHNVDVVQRIVEYFLMQEQQQQQKQQKIGKTSVSKLLDNYLAEIARDPNLSITKFQVLAESLPENTRTCHDGLYRAIDTYLKSHPLLPEHERRRLCKVMNCEKLSLDACTHAAQNDRLPLRTVVQEQQQQQKQQKIGKTSVSKLLDNYLAEIARDPNLSITKFQVLAESLPENTRTCHDGLYRAIDTYLKSHPLLPEHERRRLCKVMNCEKLSLDACTHAAQNDRLPLRTVVQVLFSEQIKMRTAMQEKETAPPQTDNSEQDESHSSTTVEIKNLKTELETVKTRMGELQRDYSELQQEYEKLSHKQKIVPRWSLGWRKIKNSIHTKVEGDETGNQQRTSNSTRRRSSWRRTLSLS